MKPVWIAPACAAVLLCSCALLPVEEELPEAPVLHAYESPTYTMTGVVRGDLEKHQSVSCTYMPAKKSGLSFSIGGERIDAVYVQEGDAVREGQLLAELEKGDLDIRIEAEENALELLELQILQLKESWLYSEARHKLELERLNEIPYLSTRSIEEQSGELNKDFAHEQGAYQNQLQQLEDGVRLQRQTLDELSAQRSSRQVTAPFAGTITYARKFEDGDKARAGERLLTLSDTSTSVFIVSREEDLPYFTEGRQLTVTCHRTDYPVTVTSAAALGLADDGQAVYLRLNSPDPTLEDGDSGTIDLLLDTRRDVLCLPSKAVSGSEAGRIVYYLDESGLRAAKMVTVGLDNGVYVEILDGLSEGDQVILN